ncbi:hypothetical protein FA13DRAFT_1528198 [Coprinellus micaceus]|uniref:Uncharacterized protein n=1 Tax=Coprinellus micaceus TaxID=71717 RepID=A0A4Y7SJH3_COPMI|nr:hypothetical protein FA13DRAFT_1528198 [Coprinellus micaceus]
MAAYQAASLDQPASALFASMSIGVALLFVRSWLDQQRFVLNVRAFLEAFIWAGVSDLEWDEGRLFPFLSSLFSVSFRLESLVFRPQDARSFSIPPLCTLSGLLDLRHGRS